MPHNRSTRIQAGEQDTLNGGSNIMELIIRKSRPKDTPHIEGLLLAYQNEVSQYDYFKDQLPSTYWLFGVSPFRLLPSDKSNNTITLVAEYNEQIIGLLTCEGGDYFFNKHVATLKIIIDPKWQKQGFGSTLLLEAINWARETNFVKRIQSTIPSRNEQALHIFKKFGFTIEGKLRETVILNNQSVDDSIVVAFQI